MRALLKELGLEPEAIDKIMAEHGKLMSKGIDEVTALKSLLADMKKANVELEGQNAETKRNYEAQIAEIKRNGDPAELKKNITDLHDQIAEMKEQAAKEVAAEKEAHEATKAGYAAEKDAQDVDGKVSAALKEAGMNPAAISKALKLYDRAIVKRGKDGAISNADDVLKYFKSDWADFFGETVTKGAEVATPPANSAKPKYTLEDVKKMTQAEVNANWDKIKPIIEGKQ